MAMLADTKLDERRKEIHIADAVGALRRHATDGILLP